MNLFDAKFLFASLVWGAVGTGYFIYGKKQQATWPLVGGVVMVAASYLIGSALLMSLVGGATMAAVYFLGRNGE